MSTWECVRVRENVIVGVGIYVSGCVFACVW